MTETRLAASPVPVIAINARSEGTLLRQRESRRVGRVGIRGCRIDPPSACRQFCPASKLRSATRAADRCRRALPYRCCSRHSSKTTSSNSLDQGGLPLSQVFSTRASPMNLSAFHKSRAEGARRDTCRSRYRSRCPCHKNAAQSRTPPPTPPSTGCDTECLVDRPAAANLSAGSLRRWDRCR